MGLSVVGLEPAQDRACRRLERLAGWPDTRFGLVLLLRCRLSELVDGVYCGSARNALRVLGLALIR